MTSGTALVPAPVAKLNRGLLGLRVALYAVVLYGLVDAGAPVWVLLAVAGVVALPAIRHRSLVHRRVHLGVGTSIVLELLLWVVYGPIIALDFVPIVSVSVAALLLSRRAATGAWLGAVGSQVVSVLVTAAGGPLSLGNGESTSVRREIVAMVLIAMVDPAFRAIASVLQDLQAELAERVKIETRLTEIVAEKDRLLEGAAHTLRTPLTGVLGLAEVVESGELGPTEHAELVTMIVAEGRRLVRSVDNVIVGSRLPMGRVELLARPVDLASAAHEAASGRAAVNGSAAGIGDPGRMATIIGNLVDNAEMHAQWSHRRVGLGRRQSSLVRGARRRPRSRCHGLRGDLREVRNPQRQRDPPVSMGLGLPVSRELLRAMGGDLDCVEPGNRFRGWLPLARVPARHAV